MDGAPETLSNEQLNKLSDRTHFNSDEVRRRYDAFLKDFSEGCVCRREFIDTYHKAFPVAQPDDVQRYANYMFNAYDIDSDGEISFTDYMLTLSVCERGTIDEKLKWAFSLYDINGDGQISLSEATEILTAIHCLQGRGDRDTAEKVARRIFRALDVNGDGLLSEAEFVVGAKNEPAVMDMLQGDSV
ncbi:hypothetical protein NP493_711g02040 [Ridgeia piscesae]|uniref:EF-hand domain-containing protein n=1 Tax=Ridgeia piscesae TaxID=27915 RepID=A0AAD9KQP8_RIDPI|nr:hypothetical protein NP493_711g02040 [Ridgeia piscesae]